MGRQQYLERLALGRSPFQDSAVPPKSPNGNNHEHAGADENVTNGPTYDSKGRPINKQTEERNAAMRNAQNAVLALVGVVESKDALDRSEEAFNRVLRKNWELLLEAEQERGDDLNMISEYLSRLLRWWPEALMARVQAGAYSSSQSFADIVLHGLRRAKMPGAGAVFTVFLPGVVPHALCFLLDASLCYALVEGIGRLQTYIGKSTKRRRAPKWLRITAMVVSEVLCAGVGVALMPLEYYAETQRLGLAPTWPLLPHWRSFLPTDSASSHRYLWTSSVGFSRFRFLASPGFWLLFQKTLTRYQDEETPIAGQFTAWEYPAVNKHISPYQVPSFRKDPLGCVFYQGCLVRSRIMAWLGYRLMQINTYTEDSLQNNELGRKLPPEELASEAGSVSMVEYTGRYRSTSLSMQMAKYLAERIDYLFQKLLVLPLESLVLRAVTQSFLILSLPKTPLAITAAQTAYSPFGGGPLGGLIRQGSDLSAWKAAGGYLSKLGLSLALYCSTEIAISFMIYGIYRRQGLRNFHWGTPEETSPEAKRIEEVEDPH